MSKRNRSAAFKPNRGFAHLPLEKRVLRVLRHQKQHHIGIRVLEMQAQVDRSEREEFYDLLDRMERSGDLWRRRNSVVLSSNQGLVTVQIMNVNERFGFARPMDGADDRSDDIFLPGRFMQGAMPGDKVLVRLSPKNPEDEKVHGSVVRIVERSQAPFTGVVVREPAGYYIRPDKMPRFLWEVEKGQLHGAKNGDKVLAHISARSDSHFSHKVSVDKAFGSADFAQSCCQAVLEAHGAKQEFNPETLQEARELDAKGVDPADLKGRLDLTAEKIFTIDGEDSKDLDDAVSLDFDGERYFLGVHIADVSHYVRQGSAIDNEAFERGTSVYYADRVLPMLPKELSNGICSLNPGEVRLTFSALITLKKSGEIEGYRFAKSYIRSRVKGVYKEVNAILDGTAGKDILQKYDGITESLERMRDLAAILRKRRFDRGAMNIVSNESKFVIENGRIQDILPRPMGESEHIIEEFMLAANEAAATFAQQENIPFVYRVHERPPKVKAEQFCNLLNHLGMNASALRENPEPKDFSQILQSVEGSELEPVINNQLLRTMSKAIYSEKNMGHFGLVLENYAHFTAPIRRYPDLSIHRILTSKLAGMPEEKLQKRYSSFVQMSSRRSSDREVEAMNIERECEACYKAEYMASRIGQDFEGMVSGVTNYGFYVELQNSVEGMVSVHDLPMGEYTVEDNIELKNENSGKSWRIGQKVTVRVASVDVSLGQVNFVLP